MGVYRVAAFSQKYYPPPGCGPEGKRHAYVVGAKKTVCGFGLSGMRQFPGLEFTAQEAADRCPMCARTVAAVSH